MAKKKKEFESDGAEIVGPVLNEATAEEIAAGTAGHEMLINENEIEAAEETE